MTRQETVDALKSAAKGIGVSSVMAQLQTVAPWLSFPILNSIAKWLVSYIIGVAIDKSEMGAFFLFIDVRTSLQGRKFAEAAFKNREAQTNGSPIEKAEAEANLIMRFRDLVKFTT